MGSTPTSPCWFLLCCIRYLASASMVTAIMDWLPASAHLVYYDRLQMYLYSEYGRHLIHYWRFGKHSYMYYHSPSNPSCWSAGYADSSRWPANPFQVCRSILPSCCCSCYLVYVVVSRINFPGPCCISSSETFRRGHVISSFWHGCTSFQGALEHHVSWPWAHQASFLGILRFWCSAIHHAIFISRSTAFSSQTSAGLLEKSFMPTGSSKDWSATRPLA